MRFLPDPNLGHHPALPAVPPPLISSPVAVAPIFGGLLGTLALLGTAVTRRAPSLAIQTAATSTSIFGFAALAHRLEKSRAHREFLKSKGVEPPSPKLLERWTELDQENVLFAAGLLGVMFRVGRARPGGLLSRWCRVEPKQIGMGTEVLGSFTFGTFAGMVGMWASPLPGTPKALLEMWRDRQIAGQYRHEIEGFEQEYGWSFGLGWLTRDAETPEQSSGPSESLQRLGNTFASLGGLGGGISSTDGPHGIGGAPSVFSSDVDGTDPRPHHSEVIDGKRIFLPSRNHEYEAKSVKDLEDHLSELQTARASLLPEAELIWHKMAVMEGKDLPLSQNPATADEVLEDMRVRVTLRILNNTHCYLWSQISDIDWMIMDTNKQILQWKAKQANQTWEPGMSDKTKDPIPTTTIDFLAITLAQRRVEQALMDSQMLSIQSQMDKLRKSLSPETQSRGWNQEASRQELDDLERLVLTKGSLDAFVKACEDLINELGKGKIDVEEVLKKWTESGDI
ncbi:hypothetical protein KVT40_000485 [Elsinoe batatas]|uniref:Uncharacterized protein n=1 Tax=Elsinoe batatas TaxID=2601811 RepID=A0A8K0LC59_9PEZI|nr:hypothetical protein KVT40_000485 [Elsinoe batatas]